MLKFFKGIAVCVGVTVVTFVLICAALGLEPDTAASWAAVAVAAVAGNVAAALLA